MMKIDDVATLITAFGALLGSIVLFYKAKVEKGKMDRESFGAELTTIRQAYSEMLKDQIESVVAPMERRVDRLNKHVSELQREVDELKAYRGKFEIAIMYIRSLCHWIDIKDKAGIEKPKMPQELKEYLIDKKK